MPKQEGQKSKLVTLLRILEQRTDENHRLNVPQLWATTSSCSAGAAAGTGWPAVHSSFRS